MFSRIDRYVFREWAKVFLLSLGVILGLLLIADMQNDLSDLLGYGAGGREILKYYLVLTPSFLPAILPISLLVSLLYVLGQLHRRHEFTAMRAAGLSLVRITRSLWFAGMALSGSLLWLNAEVVPWSVETSRVLWNNLYFRGEMAAEKSAEEIGVIQNLTFHHPENGRIWFVNTFNEFQYRAYGVSVFQLGENGRESSRLLANEGYYSENFGYWVLLNGREVTFDPETGDALRSLPFDEREFPELDEDPALMQFLKKRPQDLSFWQLGEVIDALAESADPRLVRYQIRYYSILVNPLSCLIVVGIAIPFALRGVRTNPMVGVAKSVALFLFYYVVTSASGLLGGALVSPAMAALLPNLCMILFAVFLFWRAARPA
jgi:lipopolysaccharide export system permease protein